MNKIIYLIAFMVAFSAAQGHDKKQSSTIDDTHIKADGHDHNSHKHVSKKMQDRNIGSSLEKSQILAELIDSYLLLKNALVNADSKKAASSADLMLKAFAGIDTSKVKDVQKKEYAEIAENSQEQLEHIARSPIDHQREHFEVLSEDLNDLISLIGTDKQLFIDYCPMHNNGKGAAWVSETKDIRNPYYGAKMLNCGEVKKVIN